MKDGQAILALAALAQQTRLQAFRVLMKHEPDGLAAGDLARMLEVPQNTLSAHLTVLARAELVISERHSRSIIYRGNLRAFQGGALFLLQDCCGGWAEVCGPVLESLKPAVLQEACVEDEYFDHHLTFSVALCIVAGVTPRHIMPVFFGAVAATKITNVNLPIAILIRLMIVPMLLKIDFGSLSQVREHYKAGR